MQKISLTYSGFPDPVWFRNAVTRSYSSVPVRDNAVEIKGQTLRLETPLADGTLLRVELGGQFYAMLEAEVAAEEAADQARHEARARMEAQHRRERENRWRAVAEAFNATIKLPVAWCIGIKDVLSGLSPNSWGDGQNSRTVNHIELLGELHVGRLRRKAGDFLCTSNSGTNGKQWAPHEGGEKDRDGDGNEYMPQPTCRQCLKLVERFRTETLEN